MKHQVTAANAPKAIGPYSQAIKTGTLVLCSGQLGVSPQTGELVEGGVKAQTKQALENIAAVLTAAGSGLEGVVKTTVFLQHMDDFAAMNEIYGTVFTDPYPARSTIEVAKLPKGGLVEIECIARVKKDDNCCGGNCQCGGSCACKDENK